MPTRPNAQVGASANTPAVEKTAGGPLTFVARAMRRRIRSCDLFVTCFVPKA
jgi:hypothetical protein